MDVGGRAGAGGVGAVSTGGAGRVAGGVGAVSVGTGTGGDSVWPGCVSSARGAGSPPTAPGSCITVIDGGDIPSDGDFGCGMSRKPSSASRCRSSEPSSIHPMSRRRRASNTRCGGGSPPSPLPPPVCGRPRAGNTGSAPRPGFDRGSENQPGCGPRRSPASVSASATRRGAGGSREREVSRKSLQFTKGEGRLHVAHMAHADRPGKCCRIPPQNPGGACQAMKVSPSGGESILRVQRCGDCMDHCGDAHRCLHCLLGQPACPHKLLVAFHAHAAAIYR